MAISRAAATATLEDASEGSSRTGAVRAWWAARSFRGKLLVAGGGLVAVVVVIAAAVGSSAQAEVATATSGQGLDEGLFEIGTADDETSGNSDDDDDSSTNLAVECDFPGPSCEIDSENISAAALLCAEYSGCAFDEAQETCTVIEACTCLDTPESECDSLDGDEDSCDLYEGCEYDTLNKLCSPLAACEDALTEAPTSPTSLRTLEPTMPTMRPTPSPTMAPTPPTASPTSSPTMYPTAFPTSLPTPEPTQTPKPTPTRWSY